MMNSYIWSIFTLSDDSMIILRASFCSRSFSLYNPRYLLIRSRALPLSQKRYLYLTALFPSLSKISIISIADIALATSPGRS